MNRLLSTLDQRHRANRFSVAGNTVSAVVAACLACIGCASTSGGVAHDATVEKARLDNFDDLDFNVFTHQKWNELGRSHAQDILVHWPDGHTTKGLAKHTEDMKGMFVFAPDYRVTAHTVKIAGGEWTSVVGVFEGTFTQPMPVGDGKTVPPTGKPFKMEMVTVGHWTKDGVMDEEYLFWDSGEFMKQIGLAH